MTAEVQGRIDCSCGAVITPAPEGSEDVVGSVVYQGCDHCKPQGDEVYVEEDGDLNEPSPPDNSVGVSESAPTSEGGQ